MNYVLESFIRTLLTCILRLTGELLITIFWYLLVAFTSTYRYACANKNTVLKKKGFSIK